MRTLKLAQASVACAEMTLTYMGIPAKDFNPYMDSDVVEWGPVDYQGQPTYFFYTYGDPTIYISDMYERGWGILGEVWILKQMVKEMDEKVNKALSRGVMKEWFAATDERYDFLSSLNFEVPGYTFCG